MAPLCRRRRFPALAAASAAVAVLVLAASTARAQVTECPISAGDAAKQDYTAVKAACVAGPDFCGACACALIDVFAPALAASAATAEDAAAMASADPVALTSDVLTICVPNVLPAVLAAGIPLSSLEGLTSCDFSGGEGKAPVPQCLTERVAAITGGTPAEAVTAADDNDEDEQAVLAAQGPSNLRVATVQQLPGGGVTVTLAGQLNDVAGLLQAFARSDALLDALPEQEAGDVKRLAAAPAALAASADTNAYLSKLQNPVDAVAVVQRLAAIDAAAPKPPGSKAPATNGGNGAAAPAVTSSSSAASLAGSALMGGLLAAVILFA